MKSNARIASLASMACALSLAFAPAQTPAVVPLVAGLGKQILQNMIFGQVKTQLIGSLAQMGCKGAKVVSLFSEAEQKSLLRRGPPGGGAMMPPTLADTMPSARDGSLSPPGGALPRSATGSPGAMPETVQLSGRQITGGPLPPGMSRVGPYVMPDMPDMTARMQQQAGAYAGARPPMTPEQAQRASATMDQGRQALSQPPLSRAETLGVFGELKDMGVLSDDLYAEARDCIQLAPDSAAQQLGHTGALFKTMVLPQLAEMRGKLAALPPDQQQQLADEMSQALREAKPADRIAFRDGLGNGFFPPAVLKQVRASGALD